METRLGKITASKAGGTASSGSKTYKLSLPSAWVNAMGLAGDGGRVVLSFDGEAITLRPEQSMEQYKATRLAQGHEVMEIRYYNGDTLCTLIYADKTAQDNLKDTLMRLSSDKRRIAWLAEETAALTGLEQFPQYLTLLFVVDALFLNDDRHLNNIAVLEKNGQFDYCPIFDNGAGLLSNVRMAPMDIGPAALIRSAKARPFNTTFNRQVIHARNLYGPQLHIPKFTAEELCLELEEALSYYAQRDRGMIADRVCRTILARQKEHYKHSCNP